jgi:hypothetical protein
MVARTYRSVPDAEPARTAPEDSSMFFVAVIVWVAALCDVVGVAARHAAFGGLDAIALLTVVGLTLASVRAALARLRRGYGAARG